MIIAGGVYLERCVTPDTTQLLGSAGRAALGLSSLRNGIVLHTFHPVALWPDLEANFRPYGIECRPSPSSERIEFSYVFPLARPVQSPAIAASRSEELINGRDVLSFGCVEGDFVVRAQQAVFDPQGAPPRRFREHGAQARRLAVVLNAKEVMARTSKGSIDEAAGALLSAETADVVLVKDGPNGAYVFEQDGASHSVPAYASSSNYKIGSGDVFSSIFAHCWFDGMDPASAADLASRYTAAYVESAALPLPTELPHQVPRRPSGAKRLVLVVPLASTPARWFAHILREAVHDLGVAEVEVIDLARFLAGDVQPVRSGAAMLVCAHDREAASAILSNPRLAEGAPTIFMDTSVAPQTGEGLGHRIVSDLSQALYEACWAAV